MELFSHRSGCPSLSSTNPWAAGDAADERHFDARTAPLAREWCRIITTCDGRAIVVVMLVLDWKLALLMFASCAARLGRAVFAFTQRDGYRRRGPGWRESTPT